MSDERDLSGDLRSLRIAREPAAAAPPSGTRRLGWLWTPLALLGLGAGGYAFVQRGSVKDRFLPREVDVGAIALISPSQGDVTLVSTGYVVSRRKATLAPKVAGRLWRRYVDEGDRVKQDQLVAELDRADVEAQLNQARADVAAARAKVEQARADAADAAHKAKREAELLARGAGTQANADDAAARATTVRAQLAAAEADVESIQARIRTAQVALDNTKVRAPFDGTVLRKLAEVGEMVSPVPSAGGSAIGIVTIASLDALEVEADVSESQLYRVLPATGSQKGGAPAEIVLDAFPDRRFRGQVTDVRPTVDKAKATVTVKVRFVDPVEGVLPDMAAKVSFLSRPLDKDALAQAPKKVVPADAVVEREGRKVVFVVDGGVARAVPLSIKGPAGSGLLEMIEGPSIGAAVVRAPGPDLADGAHVKTR